MTFREIDSGNVNPKHGQSRAYDINCALSVLTAEARARGIDVRALGVIEPKKKGDKPLSYQPGEKFNIGWLNAPNIVTYDVEPGFNGLMDTINLLTKENGRYYLGFEGVRMNHAVNLYRVNSKLYIYDQQINGSYDLLEFMKKMGATKFEVLRLDTLLFDKTFIDYWMKC